MSDSLHRYLVALFALVLLSSNQLISADYYWIGGSGNWSDLSHWVTTSGGNVTHSQIPTSEDNIIFDAASFTADGQTVTFDNDIVFGRTFDFSAVDQNVIIRGGRNVIASSFGSFVLSPQVNFQFQGILNLTGDLQDNTLNFGNSTAAREVYFSGSASWNLESRFEVDSILQINSGTLTTNSQNIRTRFLYVMTDSPKNLNLNNSDIEVWGKFGRREFYDESLDTVTAIFHTTNLIIDPGESTINYTAPLVEVRFTGNGNIQFHDVIHSSPIGRNYLRQFNSDVPVTYAELSLLGSARIEGNHSLEVLSLNQDKIYRLESGRTFNTGNIIAQGTCARGIVITSSFAGAAVTLNSSNPINLDFVTLRDIRGAGGTFSATNSTDLGNNTNWTFTNSNSVDFYWIGGTGVWNDPMHWSLSSGGPSSGCVPTGKDNVFFDQNSFTSAIQEVEINIQDVFVRNMTWNGVATGVSLVGEDLPDGRFNNIHITGSLQFDANMNHDFDGIYFFESLTTGNTITSNGIEFNRDVEFSGTGADWTLLDSFYVERVLRHNSGTLITGGNFLEAWQYRSEGNRTRRLDLSGSRFELHDTPDRFGNAEWRPEWVVLTDNYSLDASNSTIEFRSSHYVEFRNQGTDLLNFNNVVFSSYGGTLNHSNYNNYEIPIATIDTLIYHLRGEMYGPQDINYVKMTAGFDYIIGTDVVHNINILDANGTCGEGQITINSSRSGIPASFNIPQDFTFTDLSLRDIHSVGNGQLTAVNSLDNGNNDNWNISEITSRTLYWVGNTGAWEDSTHWSLMSGGAGGECIPTAIDDVFFDQNSFTEEFQSVYSDANRFNSVHDMTWENVFGEPNFGFFYNNETDEYFGTDRIRIYGSLTYDPGMRLDVYWHHFNTSEQDTVVSANRWMGGIIMEGEGDLHFTDNLENWNFDHLRGNVHFHDIIVRSNWFSVFAVANEESNVYGYNSTFRIGQENSTDARLYIENIDLNQFFGEETTIILEATKSSIIDRTGSTFDQIISTDPNVNAIVGDRELFWNDDPNNRDFMATLLRFAGNATLIGEMQVDSLIGSAGKTYTLESGATKNISSYLQMIGNNCTPIQLLASSVGQLADINMPSNTTILADFIEMRDQRGIGGAEFIAGARSTDIANSNVGWIFDTPPDFVETGFLGIDQTLCDRSSFELSAYNFSPNESYIWNDGSTDTTILITETGTYRATVTFDNGCEVTDEIIVLEPQDIQIDLPSDTLICEGTSLALNGSLGIQGVSYIWQDSLRTPNRDVTEAGQYLIRANVDGCFTTDSINVTVQDLPDFALEEDQTLCEGETYTADAEVDGASYLWQDGSTFPTLSINTEGIYFVEAAINGCTLSDTIEVFFTPLPIVNLGQDQTYCDGDPFTISLTSETGVSYVWNDGATDTSITRMQAGTYSVTGDNQGCLASDSITISYDPIPQLELGDTQAACDGATIRLASNIEADNYNWNTGSTQSEINVSTPGIYNLTITEGACTVNDSVEVILSSFPVVDIGSDTTLCENAPLTLQFDPNPDFNYSWQDGSSAPSYSVSTSGTYILQADNQGCVTIDSVQVTFDPLPALSLDESEAICDGEEALLQSGVIADSYLWSSGETSADVLVSSPGTYSVTVSAGACAVSAQTDVIVSTFPIVELGNDTLLCEGQTLSLTTSQDPSYTILWQDGSNELQYDVSEEGIYRLEVSNNGCSSIDSVRVDYQVAPVLTLPESVEACEGDIVQLDAGVTTGSFSWNTQDATPEIEVTDDGTYTVMVTDGVCVREDQTSVRFNLYPVLDLGPADTSICDREVLQLRTTQDGIWQDGSLTSLYEARSEGIYKVTLDNNGCAVSDSINLTIRPLPEVDLGEDQTLCDGQSTIIEAPEGLTTFTWEDGSTLLERELTSTSTLWIEAEENNCTNRDSIIVTFNALPTLSLGQDTTVCEDDGFTIRAEASSGMIFWPDGSVGNTFEVTTPGTIVAVADDGCESEASVNINFRECFYFDIYIPNAFSMSASNGNQVFVPQVSRGIQILDYDFRVYNRWGSEVFATQDISAGWNGIMNNQEAQPGIYVYRVNIQYQDDNGIRRERIGGDVLLVE